MPEQVWVADITYVQLGHGHVYLAVIMDVFTRAIRGWQLSRNLDAQSLSIPALKKALQTPLPDHSPFGSGLAICLLGLRQFAPPTRMCKSVWQVLANRVRMAMLNGSFAL